MNEKTTQDKLYRIAELYLGVPPHVVVEHLGEAKWEELVTLYRTAFLCEEGWDG